MRIDRISIDNFLSFRNLEWSDVDPELNFIVGPNDAGKTNLFRAARMIVDVLGYEQRPLWEEAAHRTSSSRAFTVSLDVQLTGEWEQKVICAYIGAALCNESTIPEEVRARFSEFIRLNLAPSHVSWLFVGQLVVHYDGTGRWTFQYRSRSTDPFFSLDLDSSIITFREPSSQASGLPLLDAWKSIMPEESVASLQAYLAGTGKDPPLPDLSGLPLDPPNWVRLEVRQNLTGRLPIHNELEQHLGVTGRPPDIIGARFVYRSIIQRQVVFTDNVRRIPKLEFPVSMLATRDIDLSNGEQLALHLFLKKNGAKPEREEFKRAQDLFEKLAAPKVCNFDVGIKVRDPREVLAMRNQTEREESLQLGLWTVDDRGDMPLEFSGAGIAEELFLSSVIEAGQDRVVLLDEPAPNLHPTVQRTIVKEIRAKVGKQFFIVTHSPWLIPDHAISKVSRFYLSQEATVQAALSPSLTKEELSRIQKELRRSTDAAALLFSRGVIMCEGETEVGALPVWFEAQYGRSLEQASIAIYSVGGDPGFETSILLLKAFAVPWAIVCDAKVIMYHPRGRSKNIAKQMRAAGLGNVPDVTDLDFKKRCEVLRNYGVFTTATQEDQEFEHLPVVATNSKEAEREVGDSKVRKGRYIAEKHACPPEVSGILRSIMEYLERKAEGSISA